MTIHYDYILHSSDSTILCGARSVEINKIKSIAMHTYRKTMSIISSFLALTIPTVPLGPNRGIKKTLGWNCANIA